MRADIQRGGRQGSAMFTVLGIIFLLSGLLAVLMTASLQRVYMARRLADRVRALSYAEAGVHEAYSMIATNWAMRTNAAAFPVTTYHHGTYDVTVTAISTNVASITSVGFCGDSDVDVILDIKNLGSGFGTPGWHFDETAFDYAMVCGDELTYSGSGDLTTTNGSGAQMHSNGDMVITGTAGTDMDASSSTKLEVKSASASVDGDVSAPDLSVHSKAEVTGSENEEAVPLVPIPDIDLTPFYNWALDHGEVVNGFSMGSSTYTPNGGILWVNGDVQLSANYQFNGSIIATGRIKLTGQGDLAPTTCAFGVVSRDGPGIQNQSSGTIEGLIYVKNGDYDHTANGRVEGQVIVQGDIKKAGSSDVFVFKQYIPTLPDGSEPTTVSDVVGVSAWQK